MNHRLHQFLPIPFISHAFNRQPERGLHAYPFKDLLPEQSEHTIPAVPLALPVQAPAFSGTQTTLGDISETVESYTIIGQFKNTYIMLEKEDGIFFVDQHAAHERILYELCANRFKSLPTIPLLFPITISLSNYDMGTITPYLDLFAVHSITIEPCGINQLMITSTPVHVKNISFSELLAEVIQGIKEFSRLEEAELHKKVNEHLQAQMACKAAVKAGDILNREQQQQLLADLSQVSNRFTCPHGRPTGWLLSTADIEKKFRRKN